jgi:hypothetical protein
MMLQPGGARYLVGFTLNGRRYKCAAYTFAMLRAAIAGIGTWRQNLVASVQGKSKRIRFVAGATGTPAFPVRTARRMCFPYAFAVPAGVLREGELNMGCTEVMSPWGDAIAERTA